MKPWNKVVSILLGIILNASIIFIFITPSIAQTNVFEDFEVGPGGFSESEYYFVSNGRFVFRGNRSDSLRFTIWNGGHNPSDNWYPQPGDSNYFEDFFVSVDIDWEGGEDNWGYGLRVCTQEGSSGEKDSINFWISKNGWYRITKYKDGKRATWVDWTKSSSIRSYNNLSIKKEGGEFRFYINNKLVEYKKINEFCGGGIGLIASHHVDVNFDNFSITLSGVSENLIYFPHIASSSTWETEICIINTNSQQNLNGELKAYSNLGQEVDSKSVALTPKARREIVVGNEFTNPSDIGYIILSSDSESVCGYLKFYINGKYRVAIPAASDVNTGDVYISHIASDADWTTGISILNTTSSSKNLTIEFDNGRTKIKTISAYEHQAFTIRDLFGSNPQSDINSAEIKNGNGIVGLEIFGTTAGSGLNYLSGILLKDETTTTIYYPHVASGSIWGTGIVAYNPSMTSNSLTITPYNESGTLLSLQAQSLAGQEKYVGSPESLNLPAETAWFSIEASSPITGFELFSTTDGNQLGGYTGVGISGTNGVFAKIDKDGGTGIAFVNIENMSIMVTITAYDDNGNVIATEPLNLSAYEKVVDVPSDLFSKDISSATYIAYSSTGNVVGFQLNVSSDGMMLDALPGM